MTTDEKLAAILAVIQTDPAGRGLARIPGDNLFMACAGDYAAACKGIARHPNPSLRIVTGFFIPSAAPPAYETDGPLGAVFLMRGLLPMGISVAVHAEPPVMRAIETARITSGLPDTNSTSAVSHLIGLERAGPSADGCYYNMRGQCDPSRTEHNAPFTEEFTTNRVSGITTIGIGDGGNEIGMGKILYETIVKNIPQGDLIHCRVSTDHLIAAGVSNWGAYALVAGIHLLRGILPAADLFDPHREREILEIMVGAGPLVDGVAGTPTATVDGLDWQAYTQPLVRMREILEQ